VIAAAAALWFNAEAAINILDIPNARGDQGLDFAFANRIADADIHQWPSFVPIFSAIANHSQK
jgi:hypothetical protein